mgnify:CR=1 FL=1|jgi:hypothetical protein
MYSNVRSLDRETTTRRDAKGFTRDANDRSDARTTSANERRERRRVTTIERHGGPRDDSRRRRFVCTARPPARLVIFTSTFPPFQYDAYVHE